MGLFDPSGTAIKTEAWLPCHASKLGTFETPAYPNFPSPLPPSLRPSWDDATSELDTKLLGLRSPLKFGGGF